MESHGEVSFQTVRIFYMDLMQVVLFVFFVCVKQKTSAAMKKKKTAF